MIVYLLPLTIAVLLQAPLQTHAFDIDRFHTTFRLPGSSDVQPMTTQEALHHTDYEYLEIDENACNGTTKFAGYRWINGLDLELNGRGTSMIIIFDAQGNAAGMQSVIPSSEFYWDCTENEFYTKENITMRYTQEYCMTTIYFRDPSTICDKEHNAPNKLHLQKGDSFKPENLVTFPETFKEAENNRDQWTIDNYFLGMGHHITNNEKDSNDCQSFMPIQALYAFKDGHCHNTGFVWMHANTVVKGSEWEEPPESVVKLILSKPAQCQLDGAKNKVSKTMHVFLGGSTTYCFRE